MILLRESKMYFYRTKLLKLIHTHTHTHTYIYIYIYLNEWLNPWLLDNWLLGGPLRSCIEGPFLPHEEQRRVSSLRENHLWKFKDFHFPLPTHLEQLINSLSIAQLTVMSDTYVWSYNKGICLAKSASKFLRIPFNKNQWNWIWTLPCPKKIQI